MRPWRPRRQPISDREVLPLGVEFSSARVASVVETIPRVPARSVPAHLNEPGPDLAGGASIVTAMVDARMPSGISSAPVGPLDFLIAGAPPNETRPHNHRVRGRSDAHETNELATTRNHETSVPTAVIAH